MGYNGDYNVVDTQKHLGFWSIEYLNRIWIVIMDV